MKRLVNIGQNQIALESNAATSIRYKQTFRGDLLKDLAKLDKAEENETFVAIEYIQKLAYIMNKQAAGTIKEANEDDFVYWLEQFEEADFQNLETIGMIIGTWNKNIETTSDLKKEAGPQ